MTKTKSTKRALLLSALSLLMCVSMLIGSTFAWFTDSVTSAGNIIKSGTLDVEMYWADGTEVPESANWEDASEGAIFNYDLWEPGYVEVRHIKIANEGTLALKYQLKIMANGEVSDLSDVIDVYYLDPAQQIANRTALTEDIKLGTLTEVLAGLDTTASGKLAANTADTVTLALKMQESAGNEYQGKSIGSDFSVILMATQLTAEEDSFDEQYDKEATFLNKDKDGNWLISNAAELVYFGATVNSGKNYKNETVKLTADIDLAGYNWKPAGNLVSYPGITFAGEFDGQGHTIANMNTTDTTANHASAGFFGSTAGAKIHNVTFKNATVTSTHYAGVVVGYEGANSSTTVIENVVIDGANVTTAAELINGEWDNGDKAGGIAGYSTSMTITGCTVKNSTIIGYRDIGGIIGYADAYPATTVTGNTVENTVVKCDITHNYKNYATVDEYDIGAVVGELDDDSVVDNNTETDVEVIVPVIVTNAEQLKTALENPTSGGIVIVNKNIDMANATVAVADGVKLMGNGDVTVSNALFTVADDQTASFADIEFAGATTIQAKGDGALNFTNCEFNVAPKMYNGFSRAAAIIGSNQYHTIDLYLEDCTFNYTAGSVDKWNAAIFMWSNVDDCVIKNCTFNGYGFMAIKLMNVASGANIVFEGNTFDMCENTAAHYYNNNAVQIMPQHDNALTVKFINNTFTGDYRDGTMVAKIEVMHGSALSVLTFEQTGNTINGAAVTDANFAINAN